VEELVFIVPQIVLLSTPIAIVDPLLIVAVMQVILGLPLPVEVHALRTFLKCVALENTITMVVHPWLVAIGHQLVTMTLISLIL
jgi:hypothetical protein